MNTDLIKKELKDFATRTNLQRRNPSNCILEIYTAQYLPEPYESLVLFMSVFFERDAIEIQLLREKEWEDIDFLTGKFPYELDENYTDEDNLGVCKKYIFNFYNEEEVIDFLSLYQNYVQKLFENVKTKGDRMK